MTHDERMRRRERRAAGARAGQGQLCASRGVEFLMINAEDDARRDRGEGASARAIPVLVDERRLVSESLQLDRAGEVLVHRPEGLEDRVPRSGRQARRPATRC